MPQLDADLDVLLKDEGACSKCDAPIAPGAPGGLCPACLKGLRALPAVITTPSAPPSEEAAAARKELARRELARRHLVPYMQLQMPAYAAGWVHRDIAARLERFLKQVVNQESPRLILNMPPRHGKSLEVSQFFPAWALGKYPWLEFINASHTASLAVDFSRKVRSQLEDPDFTTLFPAAKVDPNNRNAMGWKTTDAGGYLPAGVGGAITGKGAHIGIVDDFLKNRDEARSSVVLNSIWEWYTSTFYTRLAPGGGILLIATRWVMDDLVGRLIEKMNDELDPGDRFEVVMYPALAEHDEYRQPSGKLISLPETGATLLRKKGEALHPERWPVERLMKIKGAVSPDDWAALYQQNPVSSEASLFKEENFDYYDEGELPKTLTKYSAWDLAVGQKERNDYRVGLTGGIDAEDTLWLVDLKRGKWNSAEMVELILDTFIEHGEDIIGIEKGHIEMTLGPFIEKRIAERSVANPELSRINIVPLPPKNRDKVARSASIRARLQQGKKVKLPRNAPWVKPFVDELLVFTGVGDKRDDQVDVFAWLGIMLADMTVPGQAAKKREPAWMQKALRQVYRQHGAGKDWRAA